MTLDDRCALCGFPLSDDRRTVLCINPDTDTQGDELPEEEICDHHDDCYPPPRAHNYPTIYLCEIGDQGRAMNYLGILDPESEEQERVNQRIDKAYHRRNDE